MIRKASAPLMAFVVALLCLVVYSQTLNSGFINVDDPDYILNNELIRQLNWDTVVSAFTQSHLGWWMPLTWISLAIDYQLWELGSVGYHLTNILLHAVNTGIVVLIADAVIRAASRHGSVSIRSGYAHAGVLLAAGLFFGVHPLRVESVAWVTERKDVLNGLFAFSSVLFYLHFVEKKESRPKGGGAGFFYFLSLFCFVCSLMAKSVSVVLPVMLMVLDWSPLGRLRDNSPRRLIIEKLPFWAAAAMMTIFTFLFAAQSQHLVTYDAFPLGQRLMVSGNAIWEYWRMLLLPVGLSPFNVIPDPIPVSYGVKASVVSIILVGIALAGRERAPRLAACLLCFLLPLLPVLAFFQNGDQSYADRFTYLPSLSPAIFLGLFLCSDSPLLANSSRRRILAAVAATAVVFFMVVTVRQQGVWKSSETFWTRVIDSEPLAISYKERGRYYHGLGRYMEAVADFNSALERVPPTLKPYEYNLYAFRAESLRSAGMPEDAVRDFDRAIELHPHPAYYFHRALALQAMGKTAEAKEDFRIAGPDPGPISWID